MYDSSMDQKDTSKLYLDEKRDADHFYEMIYKSPMPFFTKDQKHRFIGASHAFLDYFGITLKELIGKTVQDFTWCCKDTTHREEEVLRTGKTFKNVPDQWLVGDKTYNVLLTLWPTYKDSQITGLMGYFLLEDEDSCKQDTKELPRWKDPAAFINDLFLLVKDYRLSQRNFGVIFVKVEPVDHNVQDINSEVIKQCQDAITKSVSTQAVLTYLGTSHFVIASSCESSKKVTKMADVICERIAALGFIKEASSCLLAKTNIFYAPDVIEIRNRFMKILFHESEDLTDHEEMLAYNKILESLMKDMPVGCYVVKPDHTLIYWNKKAEELLGFKASEMKGKKCVDKPLGCAFTSGSAIPIHSCPATIAKTTGRAYTTQMFMKRANGKELLMQNTLVPLKNQKGEVFELVSMFIPLVQEDYDADVVNRIYELTTRDALTCLPGRKYMENALAGAFAIYQRTKHPFAVLFADMNNFHAINNTYGHNAGDAILKRLGLALRKYGRKTDRFCRWGGDEFVGLLNIRDPQDIIAASRRFKKISEECYEVVGDQKIYCEAAIGITVVKDDDTIDSLIERADMYMYQAKKSQTDRIITDYNANHEGTA